MVLFLLRIKCKHLIAHHELIIGAPACLFKYISSHSALLSMAWWASDLLSTQSHPWSSASTERFLQKVAWLTSHFSVWSLCFLLEQQLWLPQLKLLLQLPFFPIKSLPCRGLKSLPTSQTNILGLFISAGTQSLVQDVEVCLAFSAQWVWTKWIRR